MTRSILAILVGTLIFGFGCATSSRRSESVFMSQFGELRRGDTLVTVRPDGKIGVRNVSKSGFVETSPASWTASPGWFVYAKEHEVWAYDGKEELLLIRRSGSRRASTTSVYGPGDFPMPVPDPVLQRINEPLRSRLSR